MKKYDNYNYEEAYQKQINTLQEYELERLLNEGKVASLYRTTTTRAKNVDSGAELLEAQIYPSFHKQSDMPKTKRRRETKPSQKNLNDKNARRYLTRLANINFGKGDLWCTFGWDDQFLPDDVESAKRDVTNFIRRINTRQKKRKLQNIKYIYIIAFDGYKRPHVHMLVSGKDIDRDELEKIWGKCKRPNTRRIQPDDNFLISGLATYISNNPHGTKRWSSSKNLIKPPEPARSYSKFRKRTVMNMVRDHEVLRAEMQKAYPGYKFLDAEVQHNGIAAAFYIYARMVRN